MSVSFGFSAGDFIAAIELVAIVIDALRESGDASSEYREIVRQLYSLETTLLRVKRLEVDPAQNVELVALQQAAAQCQRTIDNFWKKVQKYQPHLRAGGSSSRVKDGWMKIKWAVCKKEDVAKFKADLVGHTESIQLLLSAMQMASLTIHGKRQDQQNQSLAGKVQDSYFGCMQRLSNIAGSLQRIEQGKKLLEMTTKVLQTNVQVFQVVLDIQKIITRIPGQVDQQQPVYLIDALGKSSSFHLEFVRSAEALISVLKVNFKKVGQGADMIERGDFAIQDSVTKKDVDLEMDWELCFSPGQRVEMSMVFKRRTRPTSNCPNCEADCDGSPEEDIECPDCGMTFRRVLNLEDDQYIPRIAITDAAPSSVKLSDMFGPPRPSASLRRKGGEDHDEADDVSLFRRVRIYNIFHDLVLPDLPCLNLIYRVKVYELRNNDWFDNGTGFAKIGHAEIRPGFRGPCIYVESEEEAKGLLQSTPIEPAYGFQKQQDLALSFQEADACAEVWRYIDNIQQQMLKWEKV